MSNQKVSIDVEAFYAIDNLTTDENNKEMREPDKFRMAVSFLLEDCVELFTAMVRREIIREIKEKADFKGSSYNEKTSDQDFEIALSKCMENLKKVAVIANEKDIRLSNVPLIDAAGEWTVAPADIELALYDVVEQYKQLHLNQI